MKNEWNVSKQMYELVLDDGTMIESNRPMKVVYKTERLYDKKIPYSKKVEV